MLNIIIAVMVVVPVCMAADKIMEYGRNNDLYVNGYLKD